LAAPSLGLLEGLFGIGESVQAGSVLPASPVSAKAWQRQPPKSISGIRSLCRAPSSTRYRDSG
jgi:hypothetical protein